MPHKNYDYRTISKSTMDIIKKDIEGKNIIYSREYLKKSDEDFDRDYGRPYYSWEQGIILIEKKDQEYYFYHYISNEFSGFTIRYNDDFYYEHEKLTFRNKRVYNLSEMLENKLNQDYYTLNSYLSDWWEFFTCAKASKDEELISRMKAKNKEIYKYQKVNKISYIF